jgi:hypothetical protein
MSPWVKIDEDFYLHPKVRRAEPEGMALFVAGLCYSNKFLTNGLIPRCVLPSLLNFDNILNPNDVHLPTFIAEDLVLAGLWTKLPTGDYQIHDYLKYQPSRAAVLRERKQKQRAGRMGGKASAAAKARAQAPAKAPAQAKSKPVPVPDPVPRDLNTGVVAAKESLQDDGQPPPPLAEFIRAVMAQWPVAGAAFYGRYVRLEEEYGADFMWDVWLTALDSGKPAPSANYLEAIARSAVAEGRRPGERREQANGRQQDERPTEIDGRAVVEWVGDMPVYAEPRPKSDAPAKAT